MYTIRAYYLQYCGSYAPHRRRRTMDAGPSTTYYKLTGDLKKQVTFFDVPGHNQSNFQYAQIIYIV